MVNQLLAMARAEDSEQALREHAFDLARLATRDGARLRAAGDGQAHRPRLRRPGSATAPTRLIGQPVLIREMMRNLVDNALQYTPARRTVTVRVLADPFGQVVVLQVEDTGPGIRRGRTRTGVPALLPRAGHEVDGSGLGLAIVKEIATRHDTTVAVATPGRVPRPRRRARGRGALFTLRFPLAGAAPAG